MADQIAPGGGALKVDLNTIRHAYEELEQAGAIAPSAAAGRFVRRPGRRAADEKSPRAASRRIRPPDDFSPRPRRASMSPRSCARLIALTKGKETAS